LGERLALQRQQRRVLHHGDQQLPRGRESPATRCPSCVGIEHIAAHARALGGILERSINLRVAAVVRPGRNEGEKLLNQAG